MEDRKMIRKRIKFVMIPHSGMFAICSIPSLACGTAWRRRRHAVPQARVGLRQSFAGSLRNNHPAMSMQLLNGDQAMAYGAFTAGVKMVTSYPGSPSSGTVETLIELAKTHEIHVEWSSNERVAVEIGIGASIAGRRALVCTKSVGLNVMLDPLMALNLTPVHGGLVILLGDDPGGYGSQNDQDSRALAPLLEMPMLEPATPAEGYAMMQEAFSASDRLRTAIIIRETRSYAQQIGAVDINDAPYMATNLGLAREPWRFVPVPRNVVEKHAALHQLLKRFGHWAEGLPFNQIIGTGKKGIIAAGFAYQKLLEVLGNEPHDSFRLLKLSALYPLPENIIARFLNGCEEVLIVEENEPFVETHVKALAYDLGCRTKIFGKQSHHLSREGELFRWQIQEALSRFLPEFIPARQYSRENEPLERPKRKNYCENCRYDEILDVLEDAAKSLQQKPVLAGDPGCLVTVAERLDAKYAIGSAVGVADGISKAGVSERGVALFGDSSFFHTTLPAICNAVCNKSNIVMVVLDNGATATSGFQPNPGTGKNAFGENVPALSIEKISRACGVKFVRSVSLDEPKSKLREIFQEALRQSDLALIVVKIPAKNK
jgi:indolepyruvate ferredoxin oxidoreductase alpha subunit